MTSLRLVIVLAVLSVLAATSDARSWMRPPIIEKRYRLPPKIHPRHGHQEIQIEEYSDEEPYDKIEEELNIDYISPPHHVKGK